MTRCSKPPSSFTPVTRIVRLGSTEMRAPIFCSTEMRSRISGSMAALASSESPSASTAAKRNCSVAPTLGNGSSMRAPVRRSARRWIMPSRWSSWAPKARSTLRWKSTGRGPMAHPPGAATTASPVRCSDTAVVSTGMRLALCRRSTSFSPRAVNEWAVMRMLSASCSTVPPVMRMSSSTTSMSRMAAMLVRRHGSAVSSAATIALGRAFFEPRICSSPSTGTPPRTVIVSADGAGGAPERGGRARS